MEEQQPVVPAEQPKVNPSATNSPNPVTLQPIMPEQKKGPNKTLLGAIVLIILVVGGFFAYSVYASPAKIWQKFISQSLKTTIEKEEFSFSYKDNGQLTADQQKNNPYANFFSKITVSANGTAYDNSTNLESPEATADINYTLASGDTSFGSKVSLVMLGQDMYLNLGSSPFISSMLSSLSPDQKVDWIKINFKDLQEMEKTASTTDSSQIPNITDQIKQYQTILEKHISKIITVDKYIDKQDIKGVSTLHYSNKIDKNELKALFHEIMESALNESAKNNQVTPEEITKAKALIFTVVDSIIDKMEIKTLETWIGTKDFQLHKIKVVSSAPSLISLVGASSDLYASTETDPQKQVEAIMQKISYDAEFTMDEDIFDYGQKVEVKAPENALDLVKKLKEQQQIQLKDPGVNDSGLEAQPIK